MSPDNLLEGSSENDKSCMQMITAYKEILAITDQMLLAARNSNWDELVALELDCKHLTNQLVSQTTHQQLNEDLQKKKVGLIHDILERDAEIRAITEPWMVQLQKQLTNFNQQRKLGQTYQPDL